MTELVWVEVLDAVPLPERVKILRRRLRVHRLRAAFLGEYPLGDCRAGLCLPQLLQQLQNVRAYVYRAGALALCGCVVDTCGRSVLEIVAERDGTGLEINVGPLDAASLSTPDTCISD